MSANPYTLPALRRGAGAFVQGRALAGLLNLAVALALVRHMEVAQYAVYVTMGGLVVLLSELGGFGVQHVTGRYVPAMRIAAAPAAFRRFVWQLVACGFAGAVVIALLQWAGAVPVARLFNATHAPEAVVANAAFALAYTMTQRLIHIHEALLAQDAVRLGIAIEWIPKFGILVAWIALHGEASAAEALLIQAGTAGAGACALAIRLAVTLRTSTAARTTSAAPITRPPDLRTLAGFALQNYAHTVLLMPAESFGLRLLAASALGAPQMAAFGFFQSLANALRRYLPVHFLLVTAETMLVARYTETRDFMRLNATANLLLKVQFSVIAGLIGWLAVTAAAVTTLLTGGRYADLAWLLPVVLLEPMLEAQWYLLRTACNAIERPVVLVRAALAALVPFGAIAALLALGIGEPLVLVLTSLVAVPLVRNGAAVVQLRRAGPGWRGDPVGGLRISAAAAGAAAPAFGLMWLMPADALLVRAIIASAVFVPAYAGLMVLLSPFTAGERASVRRLVSDRLPAAPLRGLFR